MWAPSFRSFVEITVVSNFFECHIDAAVGRFRWKSSAIRGWSQSFYQKHNELLQEKTLNIQMIRTEVGDKEDKLCMKLEVAVDCVKNL